jgi:predicted nucleotidyltransferase
MREVTTSTHDWKSAKQGEFRVRDRDSPVTKEGIIFRVYGYNHPPKRCVCDVEYAPEQIYRTGDPRAIRQSSSQFYYKFYVDGGLRFVSKNFPEYQLFFDPLQKKLVGLTSDQILELRKPEEKLSALLEGDLSHKDKLMRALQDIIDIVTSHSKLRSKDFGVFGSILHDFYNPDFSDLDFIIYGRENLRILRQTLKDLYRTRDTNLVNEFDDRAKWAKNRHWFFEDMTIWEFCELCKNKLIYSVYKPRTEGRDFKVEFEPVRDWSEIHEEYDPNSRIRRVGWITATAEILDDSDSFFIPSVYTIEQKRVIKGPSSYSIDRIVSFVEEFRGQAEVGQEVIVKGNLEEVEDSKGKHYQIVLSRVPDYYKQILKPLSSSDTH